VQVAPPRAEPIFVATVDNPSTTRRQVNPVGQCWIASLPLSVMASLRSAFAGLFPVSSLPALLTRSWPSSLRCSLSPDTGGPLSGWR
jgi:hypothetical protein